MSTHAWWSWLRLTSVVLSLASTGTAVAADAALERAAATMGVTKLKSIRYSGDGVGYTFGQAYKPGRAWPKITVRSFVRTVNYETGVDARRDRVRPRRRPRRRRLSARGAAAQRPVRERRRLRGTRRRHGPVAGTALRRRSGSPAVDHAAGRDQGGDAATTRRSAARRATASRYTAASFTEPGRFKAVAFINADGLVERVESRVPDPVLGRHAGGHRRTPTIATSAAIKFPTRITQSQGGHPVLDLTVREVQPERAGRHRSCPMR